MKPFPTPGKWPLPRKLNDPRPCSVLLGYQKCALREHSTPVVGAVWHRPRMVNDDPLEVASALGLRVVWVDGIGGDVLLIEEHGIALADANLTRRQVADLLWESAVEHWSA